jgi:hypothetical protein
MRVRQFQPIATVRRTATRAIYGSLAAALISAALTAWFVHRAKATPAPMSLGIADKPTAPSVANERARSAPRNDGDRVFYTARPDFRTAADRCLAVRSWLQERPAGPQHYSPGGFDQPWQT